MADKSSPAFRATLKRHRDGKRWSQERLAVESDMDHSLVSRLESGQRSPTREAIEKMANGLQLTFRERDQLLMLAGYMPFDRANVLIGEDAIQSLYRYLTAVSIPPADRARVRDLLTTLAVWAWERQPEGNRP